MIDTTFTESRRDSVEAESRVDERGSDVPMKDLMKEAFGEAKQLIKLEVALAKDEAKQEAIGLIKSTIAFSAAVLFAVFGVCMLLVALALAIFPGPIPALIIGLVLVVAAVIGTIYGVKKLPKKPLANTQRRLKTDVQVFKERIA